jgi:hypothetical protein
LKYAQYIKQNNNIFFFIIIIIQLNQINFQKLVHVRVILITS